MHTEQENCLICQRIADIQQHKNPYFVAELQTGFVVIGDFQFFQGYSLFLCKQHVPELHQLEQSFKQEFLEEMSLVAQAVFECFQPIKLNYELLGNSEPHLHWHLFPRHANDPVPSSPVWIVDKSIRYAPSARPDEDTINRLKKDLLKQLKVRASDRIICAFDTLAGSH